MLATQGFDALCDLDSNGDGQITSTDVAFGELKVWQDANQDGVSQASELKTLTQVGISSIGLNGTTTGPQAGQVINNNNVALSTTFTINGQTRTVGAIDLEANNFFTEFPEEVVDEEGNPVAITAQAGTLPQMNGSGMVRNMRAAATLDPAFAASLSGYSATSTRAGQLALVDELITDWAETSTYWGGSLLRDANLGNITFRLPEGLAVAEYVNMIRVLEAFNGSRFYGDETGGPVPAGFGIYNVAAPNATPVYQYIITPLAEQITLLRQAYESLKDSVYTALVPQTRLKPYVDSIELVIDEAGIRFDLSASIALAESKGVVDSVGVLHDLLDLRVYQGEMVGLTGWPVMETLNNVLRAVPMTQHLQDALDAERVQLVEDGVVSGHASNPLGTILLGNSLGNILTGGAGSDHLLGGAGHDTLQAIGAGDTLDGGAGGFDVIELSGLNPADVVVRREPGTETVVLIDKLTGEGLTVSNGFSPANGAVAGIEKVVFADGTSWNAAALRGAAQDDALVLIGTAGYDALQGGVGNDVFDARGGNDMLFGGTGNDTYRYRSGDGNDKIREVNGGGFDTLELLDLNAGGVRIAQGSGYESDRIIDRATGQTITLDLGLTTTSWTNLGYYIEQVKFADGTIWNTAQLQAAANADETLLGTSDDDMLEGFGGNDILDGGAGDDLLMGGTGNDIYRYRKTDGDDTIDDAAGILDGGAGDDLLMGGRGSDTYLFGRGAGDNQLVEDDLTSGFTDVLKVGSGVAFDQLWFVQSGNDLKVSIIGSNDQMVITDWYAGSQYHVEQFIAGDGKMLLDSQVQNLVQAMASFSPPAPGQMTLDANYQAALAPVMAANWH